MTVVVATAASAAAVTGATTASGNPRERPTTASVTGTAAFRLPYLKDADIRSLTFDAHAAPFSKAPPAAVHHPQQGWA
ncbi:hypothetical protein [Streptomyces sp. NPDC012616]|uniref:hypothetical protein n=1 Tax=Streptomyces sp. NPDC012616 TaxID=3364840 RepID=UPI0036ECBC9D